MTRHILTATLGLVLAGPAAAQEAGPLAVPGGARLYDFQEAAVFPLIAMPGRITDIVLEPGETLVGKGPIAAGDTSRWIIGDTSSGAGEAARVHVMVKPTLPDLATNLIINTDRRTYQLELRASTKTWLSRVSWRYPAKAIVLVAAPPARPSVPTAPLVLNADYRISGDRVAWRPARVFDDGAQVFIEFSPGVRASDLPPLYRLGSDGKTAELINYHVEGQRLVAERLFDRAELRLGAGRGAARVRIVRQAPVTGEGR
jgi:P-type conjugative transfer protein TrbG